MKGQISIVGLLMIVMGMIIAIALVGPVQQIIDATGILTDPSTSDATKVVLQLFPLFLVILPIIAGFMYSNPVRMGE